MTISILLSKVAGKQKTKTDGSNSIFNVEGKRKTKTEFRTSFSDDVGKRKTKLEVRIPFSYLAGKRLTLRYTHWIAPVMRSQICKESTLKLVSLRGQTIVTLLGATRCARLPPCCNVLRYVGCCWLKFETGQIFHQTFVDAAWCCSRLARFVGNRACALIDGVNKTTHADRCFPYTPRTHYGCYAIYINSANNKCNVISSDTCHTCGITHDTKFPLFLHTKIKEKELSLRVWMVN